MLSTLASTRGFMAHWAAPEVALMMITSNHALRTIAYVVRTHHGHNHVDPHTVDVLSLCKDIIWAVVPQPSLLVAGGFRQAAVTSPYVHRYDLRRRKWYALGGLIFGTEKATLISVNRHVAVVVGGDDRVSTWSHVGQRTHRVHHELMQLFFSDRSQGLMALPGRRIWSSGHLLDGKLHVLGRMTSEGFCGMDRLDSPLQPSKKAVWTPRCPMPSRRVHAACVAVASSLYVAGGHAAKHVSNVFELYDAKADTWTTLPPMPTARTHATAAVVEGRVYVCGGLDQWHTPLATVEQYDPREGRWRTMPSMPTARHSLSVVGVGQEIYAVGGTAHNRPLGVVERFDAAVWHQEAPMPGSLGNVACALTTA